MSTAILTGPHFCRITSLTFLVHRRLTVIFYESPEVKLIPYQKMMYNQATMAVIIRAITLKVVLVLNKPVSK